MSKSAAAQKETTMIAQAFATPTLLQSAMIAFNLDPNGRTARAFLRAARSAPALALASKVRSALDCIDLDHEEEGAILTCARALYRLIERARR